MEKERPLGERALELENALNEYVDFSTKNNYELGRMVVFRINNKSGKFEFLDAVDDINDLSESVSEDSSIIVLSSFQRESQSGEILFGYKLEKCYKCDKDIEFATVCRKGIFDGPPVGCEKNLGRLHLLTG